MRRVVWLLLVLVGGHALGQVGGTGGGGSGLNPSQEDVDGYTQIAIGPLISGQPFAWATVQVMMPGIVEEGDGINGTNCGVNNSAHITLNPVWSELNEAPGGPHYDEPFDGAVITNAQLAVGGAIIANQDWSIEGTCVEGYLNQPPNARFASTHFPHNQLIEVKLTITFQPYEYQGGQRVAVGQPLTLYAMLKPRVVNRFMGWRTHVMDSGDPWGSPDDGYITDTVEELEYIFQNANYETSLFTTVASDSHRDDLESRWGVMTALGVNTHGWDTGLGDSVCYQENQLNHFMSHGWISQRIGNRMLGHETSLPTHLNIIYACSALGAPLGGGLVPALKIHSAGGAVAGFTVNVWSIARDNESNLPVSLASHASTLGNALSSGYVLQKAVELANSEVSCLTMRNGLLEPTSMLVAGDYYSTLKYVYLASNERLHDEQNRDWYKVYWISP